MRHKNSRKTVAKKRRAGGTQCHLDKDDIEDMHYFTASKHFVYSLFFYI